MKTKTVRVNRAALGLIAKKSAGIVTLCKLHGLPVPLTEHLFHPSRLWRFDAAWPAIKLAVEYEGLVWNGAGGRHQRAAGIEEDMEKYNEAVILGWRIVRVTHRHLKNGKAAMWIRRAFDA